jgi:hypothetical protein
MMIYHALDIFFLIFHTSLILFSLTGWIWRETRITNLVVLLLIGSSWLFLGLIVGVPGYCPLTDLHFTILEKLGKTDLPSSYVKYLADRLTGSSVNPATVDKVTLFLFLAVLLISVFLNAWDIIKRRMGAKGIGTQGDE